MTEDKGLGKIRVHELAKELGLENKALLDLCAQLAIPGKRSHSNSLSDEEAEKIRRHVIRRAVSDKSGLVREVTREGAVLTERRMGSVIRRRKKGGEDDGGEDEDDASDAPSIDLDTAPVSEKFHSLAPDLAAEKRTRSEALRRADALFKKREEPAAEPAKPGLQRVGAESDSDDEEYSSAAGGSGESMLHAAEAGGLAASSAVQEIASSGGIPSPAEHEEEEFSTNGSLGALESEEETGQPAGEYSAEKLADARRRLDIRAPKVLGRIELPQKAVIAKKGAEGTAGEASPRPAGEDPAGDLGRGKNKKRRTVTTVEEETETVSADGSRKKPRKKQVLQKNDLLDYEGERDGWRQRKDRKRRPLERPAPDIAVTKKIIKIQGLVTVGELAKQMSVKSSELIAKLMGLGVMAGINQLLDFDTATIVCEEFGFKTMNTEEDLEEFVRTVREDDEGTELELRPPVVTVMGHVDHGKTSLLDAIRKTSVTAKEFGGITQHIGAYNVKLANGGSVTFLDTPGHEAFTAMRSRGAQVTDIVVLVVAADDGVMPQTIEAINHAKAAKVPIIVAMNKIDKPGANVDKVLSQLSEHGLVSEEWGGETLVAKVSAHTREGLDRLLENLHLQAEILELKANRSRSAVARVIESKVDRGRGHVLTVLVQNGTLKKGDIFVSGSTSGRVRALVADDGTMVPEAGPSIPVEVLGGASTAAAGDDFIVLESEAQARRLADERSMHRRQKELVLTHTGGSAAGPLTFERFSEMVETSADMKELPLIVKGDVQGSVEAVAAALVRVSNEEVRVRVIHKGVGAVSENDTQLAAASRALIVAFNVRPDVRAASLIESEGLTVLYSRVIYDLVDNVSDAVKGKMAPKFREKSLGRVEVRQTFKVPKLGVIAGCYVLDGVVPRGGLVRLLRDGIVMFEGKMASLRRFKDDVKEVAAGYECGIGLEGYSDIKDGDIIEVYKVEQV